MTEGEVDRINLLSMTVIEVYEPFCIIDFLSKGQRYLQNLTQLFV